MAKRNPRKTLQNKLDKLCREVIKARDGGVCQKCGKHFQKIDCSHVIPRGNKRLRWDIENLKGLCSGCHLWWWHQNPLEAAEWFENKFPDRWMYIQNQLRKGVKKWTIEEMELHIEYLEGMIEYYNNIREDLPF